MTKNSSWRRVPGLFGALLIMAITLALTTWGATMLLEWRPKALVETPIFAPRSAQANAQQKPASLKLLTWNIGYAGLDAQADFFMDGGQQVGAASPERVRANINAIKKYLHQKNVDVMLLQEVDDRAKRTFYFDEVHDLAGSFADYSWTRARNFLSPFVPVPLRRPMGRVQSGLLSLSRFQFSRALRHQLPGDYNWPVRIFHLKRCLHELRFKAADGHDWVIINLHLSAFDRDGYLRRQQMKYLRKVMLKIAASGHHVIVGGDWNQAFPGLTAKSFAHTDARPGWFQQAAQDWAPDGWRWFYDARHPSLRATNKPYRAGENFVTSVDGWLLSPELQTDAAICDDLRFAHSDHNPVQIKVWLANTHKKQKASAVPALNDNDTKAQNAAAR